MRAPVSIVIPTLNAEVQLGPTLSALGEGLAAGLIRELVISDAGSDDGTAALAGAAGARLVEGARGRGGQLRRGVAASRGDWILLLHADTRLGPGWAGAVLAHITTAPDRAGYFRLVFRAEGLAPRVVAGWANLRSWLFGLPYGDQGLLLSRALYDAVGGMPDQPLMEDVEMARRLRGRLTALPATARTSAERYRQAGWLRRGTRNLTTLAGYKLGVSPARLARFYDAHGGD